MSVTYEGSRDPSIPPAPRPEVERASRWQGFLTPWQPGPLWVTVALLFPGTATAQRQLAEIPPVTYTLFDSLPAVLPFEIYGGDIRFRALINGEAVSLLLDDGFMWDELLLWGPKVDSLHLVYSGELPALGSGDSLPPPPPSMIAEGVTLQIPGVKFPHEVAVVSPPGSWYETAFKGSVGQVSGTFLKNFVVGIDFDRMLITLQNPAGFTYDGAGRAIPWEPLGFGPWGVPVTMEFPDGSRRELQVLMDLGYNNQLQVVTGGDHALPMPENTLVRTVDRGAGTEVFHMARLPSVDIGGFQLEDVLVSCLPSDHNTMVFSEVMLGLNLLSRFNVVYDFPRHRMFLEPNHKFSIPFEYNMSGFTGRHLEGGALEVRQVDEGSPAQDAGLKVGDLISHLDGRPVGAFDTDELSELWRRSGEIVRVRFVRNGTTHDVEIRLRRLI